MEQKEQSVAEQTLMYFKSKKWRKKYHSFVHNINKSNQEQTGDMPIESTKDSEEELGRLI